MARRVRLAIIGVLVTGAGCGGGGDGFSTCAGGFSTQMRGGVAALAGASLFPAITSGDFNGDGRIDLAVAANGVSILLGYGDGHFSMGAYYDRDTQPGTIVTADFDGDGHADLATVTTINELESFRVFPGNGNGTFQAPLVVEVEVGYGLLPSLAAGDFNGDGSIDLAVAFWDLIDEVLVLLGNGDGSFQAPMTYPDGSGSRGGRRAIAPGEFNGDGRLDLALRDERVSNVMVLAGGGDGSFQPAADPTSSADGTFALAVSDFDADGRADVAITRIVGSVGDLVSQVGVLRGNGDGTFQARVDYTVGPDAVREQSEPWDTNSLVTGDFDGDGTLDLAAAGTGVGLLLGHGDGTFRMSASYIDHGGPGGGASQGSVTAADFDADGRTDLALVGSSGLMIALSHCVE